MTLIDARVPLQERRGLGWMSANCRAGGNTAIWSAYVWHVALGLRRPCSIVQAVGRRRVGDEKAYTHMRRQQHQDRDDGGDRQPMPCPVRTFGDCVGHVGAVMSTSPRGGGRQQTAKRTAAEPTPTTRPITKPHQLSR